jgi:hypothetical protein
MPRLISRYASGRIWPWMRYGKKKHILFWILLTRVSKTLTPFKRYWIHYRRATVHFLYSLVVGRNYVSVESQAITGRGMKRKPKCTEKYLSQTLSATNSTRTGMGNKPSLQVQNPAITPTPPPPQVRTTERKVKYHNVTVMTYWIPSTSLLNNFTRQ